MIFHRAEDACTSSPPGSFISEGKPNFKTYGQQSHNMIRNMGYNLKKPTGLGMTEGILVPYTGMTIEANSELNCNHRIEESRLGIEYTRYQSIPHVAKNFRAKTVVYTKEYDSDDSLEADIQDPANLAIFQHPEGASDNDDAASQAIDH